SYINLAATVVNPAGQSGEVPDGSFHGKTVPAAIKLYLGLVNKKQTAREISDALKKGGLESTSRWFDKIIYATLDRLRKAGETVKVGNQWGLSEWFPALVRAGQAESSRNGKAVSKPKPKKSASSRRGKRKLAPGDTVESFLRDSPEPQTAEVIQAHTGIKNLKVAMMLLGQLVKKGKVQKTSDGKYRKAA